MLTGNGRQKENTQSMSNTEQPRRLGEGVLSQAGEERLLLWGIRRFRFGKAMRYVFAEGGVPCDHPERWKS